VELESYDLNLDVDFAKAKVKGVVTLRLKGAENPLLLDAVDMRIEAVRVNGEPWRSRFDAEAGRLRIPKVPRRESTVEIHYSKEVPEGTIFGLYKSRYNGGYMLVTDLEPAEARTVFPCKDDPSYKAVFHLTVVTDGDLKVIYNTTARSVQSTANGRAEHVFNPSPRMSTYLFFLGIGKFEESKVFSGKTAIISASRPGTSEDSAFVLNVARRVLKEYERYFGIPYPLPKLHLVGLPEFHTGAMENWGAISSREALLILEKGASLYDVRRGAYVMTHEIAHMWFGDLVTMNWWDDLWLNESFAAFMEHKMVGRLFPKWDVWRDFLLSECFSSMNFDALSSTHPIQVKVRTVNEVQQIFDAISYGKGASVLRMIEAYVGEAAFRRGVSSYLRKFRYSNARGEDLWKSIARASGKPVTRVMREWITKRGFPYIKVSAGKGGIRLSQNRFLLNGKESPGTWPIPLTIEAAGRVTPMLLDRPALTLRQKNARDLLVNPRRTGYYSVLYDEETYGEIAGRFRKLHPHDKAGIISDLWLFLQAGIVKPETYFKFLSLCSSFGEAVLIETATPQLVNLRAIADEAAVVQRAYGDYYLRVAERVRLTPRQGEDPNLGTARELLMTSLVQVNAEYARRLAPRFAEYDSVEPDLKEAVATAYCMVNGASAYEPILERLKKSSEVDRAKLYVALTASPDPSVVERSLELSIGGEVSRSDSGYTIVNAANNPSARQVTWDWITRRYETVKEIYGGAQQFYRYLDRAVPRCGIGREAEVKAFFTGQRFEEGKLTYARTLERLDVNSRLRATLLSA
jgi:tricorn protease interacting factor F2/3